MGGRRKQFTDRTCPTCNNSFTVNVKNKWENSKIYCSKKCRGALLRGIPIGTSPKDCIPSNLGTNVKCLNCESAFYVAPNELETRKYCSVNCYKNRELLREDIKCTNCNNLFHKINELTNNNFCSVFCREQFRHTGSYINCKVCLKEFYVPKFRVNSKKYCSRQCALHGQSYKYRTNPTSIEVKIYNKLKELLIDFEPQYLINDKFIVDAYCPDLNLIIECDGDYWHSLPKQMGKDKSRNAYLLACGYKLLRLPEYTIKNNSYLDTLMSMLENNI